MNYFDQAHALAVQATYLSNPNPRVGCVIVSREGRVIGTGHTQQAGSPHAEVMALRDAQNRGEMVAGAVAYVTLEPCSHHGRTPPCSDALISARLAKVVVAACDPNPLVSGRGLQALRAAGISVELCAPQSCETQATRELNIGFFNRMTRKKPWVRMKIAASIDGTTALENGVSQWITGPAARADGHLWRARACAVLTGIGTLLDDNPKLDARCKEAVRQPHLVVVDSRLQTPLNARIFDNLASGQCRQVLIYCAVLDAVKQRALEAKGATIILLPGADEKVDLVAMLQDLGRREVNELHIEAGHRLNGSLIRSQLVDEWLLYFSPKLLGPGRGLAALPALTNLMNVPELSFHAVDRVGADLRLMLRASHSS